MNYLSDKKYRYEGPQSFYNARSVNERERYYYGYFGFYGPERKPLSLYREMPVERLACDALTDDCWSKPRFPHVPACAVEGFDASEDCGKSIFVVAVIGAIGFLAYTWSKK